jgi:hypothetical protein
MIYTCDRWIMHIMKVHDDGSDHLLLISTVEALISNI